MGCRIARKEEWKNRILLEGKMHECSSFVTLTYAPEHLPADYSLSKHHFQTWMKRLRRVIEPTQIRFFGVGEYGGQNWRPHYHALIFGYDFPDKYFWANRANGEIGYRSPLLEATWPLGFSEVGSFTAQTAAYVAGYTIKKMGGEYAKEHYRRMNPATGEIHELTPEFALMSRRPGIGRTWYEENKRDVFPSDFLIFEGRKTMVPRYFKRVIDEQDAKTAQKVEAQRKAAGRKPSPDKTEDGMLRRELYRQHLHNKRTKRTLD